MKDKKLVGIDILRAAAVLLVMLYHMWVCGGTPAIEFAPLQRFISLGGEIGVTLFFCTEWFWHILFSGSNGESQWKN